MRHTGLSLGGGSLRGVAHIGVLKELAKQDISVTHAAGTSAGALIGGLLACGMKPKEMEQVLNGVSIRKHLDFRLRRKGWIKGDRIYKTLRKLTDGRHFSDLKIPFAVVCIDLLSGHPVVIRSGELAKALRASIAIPGIFSPVEMDGQLLVDGYIINNNPVDVVKEMGARYVTAVRIRSTEQKQPTQMFAYLSRYIAIASHLNTDRLVKEAADMLIDIDLHNIGRFDTKAFSRAIASGEEKTRKVLYGENIEKPPHESEEVFAMPRGV